MLLLASIGLCIKYFGIQKINKHNDWVSQEVSSLFESFSALNTDSKTKAYVDNLRVELLDVVTRAKSMYNRVFLKIEAGELEEEIQFCKIGNKTLNVILNGKGIDAKYQIIFRGNRAYEPEYVKALQQRIIGNYPDSVFILNQESLSLGKRSQLIIST